jgi:iron complex outermembrane receptor protein
VRAGYTRMWALLVVGAGVAGTAAGADESARDTEVESVPSEIIVTARRREEDAQRVPIPIATISGDSFASRGGLRLEDLNQAFPSTNIQFHGPRQTSIVVRGIGNNPANDALESGVGVYLDNVYLGRAGMANLDLIDLDQVTLLRGPQGTLFGKNTTTGVLAISTRAPAFEREASLESTVGDKDSYQVKAIWSEPLRENRLATRVSLARSVRAGYVSDVTTGRALNEADRTAGRAQLLWLPGDSFSLRTIVDYAEDNSDAGALVLWNPGPNNGAKYYSAVAAAGANVVYDPDYDVVTMNGCLHYDVRSTGASAEANWKVGGYTITSISAYRTWRFLPCADPDYTDRDAIRIAGQNVDDRQFTQELRLSSPADRPWSYVLGLFYFNQHQQNLLYTQYGADATAITALQLGNPSFVDGRVDNAAELDTGSLAAFAQVTWRPASQWELALGLRGTQEKKQVRLNRSSDGLPAFETNPSFAAYVSGLLEEDDDALSASVSSSYQFSPTLFAYASVARNDKSGGINAMPPGPGMDVGTLYFRPERTEDFELGMKASWFDRRLMVNTNLFRMNIDDYQAALLVQPGTGNTYQQILSNIGAVRTQGVEAEVSASMNAGVTFSLAASYNQAIYLSYPNAPCSAEQLAPNLVPGQKVCDLSSQPLVGAPRWLVGSNLSWRHGLFANVSGELQAGYSWHSSFFGTADNSQLAQVPSYGILNLRYGVIGKWGDHPLSLSVWSNNALDRHEMMGGVVVAGRLYNYVGTPAIPRTFGVTMRIDL